jgi:outer membrane autotransporter protein
MSLVKLRRNYAYGAAAAAIAAAAFAAPVMAGSTTVTESDANVLNLLSPFLNLNLTQAGQQTLTANLNQAIATNQAAAQSGNNIYGQPTIEAESISEKTIFSAASGSITLLGGAASYYGPGANLAGGLPQQALQNGQSFSGSGNLTATPANGTIYPYQAVGGLGNLGGAYQAAVSPNAITTSSATYVTSAGTGANPLLTGQYQTQNVVNLLVGAYSFTSTDLGVAKYYFANGTTNGTSTAVAPTGYTLPTSSNGTYPNSSTSVYDVAYGVSITQANQNTFGDSRPVQVAPNSIIQYDPNAITGLTGNPSFPSGHTNYAFTDSILIGMMTPQFFQSMLLSGSEYGNSRIDLGVHYPLDIIASRSFVQYDLTQLLSASASTGSTQATNPYYYTNSNGSTTVLNLNGQFVSAAQSLNAYLSTQTSGCGGSLTACAASNPYLTYSAQTYAYQAAAQGVTNGSTAATDSAIYQYRLTYGLPADTYAQAPRELTDTQGNTAAILLATLYGGSTPQAQALANAANPANGGNGAGLYGNLSTATINQIIYNTEGQALQAFYGTQLSYWSRIDLYDAAGYFQNGVTGAVTLGSGNTLGSSTSPINVSVAAQNGSTPAGVLGGSGATIYGNVTFAGNGAGATGGGALGVQGNGAAGGGASYQGLTVTAGGVVDFQPGSKIEVNGGVFLPGGGANTYTILTTDPGNTLQYNGAKLAAGAVTTIPVDTSQATNLMYYTAGQLVAAADPTLQLTFTAKFNGAAVTNNQNSVAVAIDTAANAGVTPGSPGANLLAGFIANPIASAPAALDSLTGEGLTGQQQAALNAGNLFVTTVMGQATFWSDDRRNDIFGLKDGGSLKDSPDGGVYYGRARLWAAGFGQYASLDGQGSTGSASVSSQNSGVATGIDYQVTRNVLLGITGGYSDSYFSVGDRATSGTIDGGHFGVYGVARSGPYYVAGTVDYSHYDNTTDRFVSGLGATEEEKGKFSSDEWLARVEAGRKYAWGTVNVTPFAGFQVAQLYNDAFSEFGVGGAIAGLHVDGQTIDSDKTFAGVQFDTKTIVGNGWVLTPYVRISWEHEFNPDRSITASLLALPANFTVYGASAAEDLARINTGFKLDVSANVALFGSFDGEFSDRGNSYAGTGGVKIRW